MTNTNIHLCNHCTNNHSSFCIIDEVSTILEDDCLLMCNDFIQRSFPYCPCCGTPFTLANEVLDPDGEGEYLEENLDSGDLIGFTCLNCGETILMEDLR